MVEKSKDKGNMTTIQVKKDTAKKLQCLANWGDTYDVVIERLLNGKKGKGEEEPLGGE